MTIDEFKKNPKTMYLADAYQTALREEAHLLELAKSDPSMKVLAEEELAGLDLQKKELMKQMEEIIASEKVEEEARKIAIDVIEKLGMVGLLAVEFFLLKDGSLLVNNYLLKI